MVNSTERIAYPVGHIFAYTNQIIVSPASKVNLATNAYTIPETYTTPEEVV